MPSTNRDQHNLLQCMEVRGGHGDAANYFRRPGLDIWIWSQSRQAAELEGGDTHYISSCASGRITRMLMADVGGMDRVFADVSGRMRDVMKQNINMIAQNKAMQQLSVEMEHTSRQGGFVSTLLSTFFAPTRSLTICNAGHPPPLLYRAALGQWSPLRSEAAESPPATELSGTAAPTEYQRLKLKLEYDDLVFCYSNALSECRQTDGRTLGVVGLQEVVRELNRVPSSATMLSDLMTRVRDMHPDNLRDSEATVILCKATNTHVAMRDNFLAPFRFLKGAADRTSL